MAFQWLGIVGKPLLDEQKGDMSLGWQVPRGDAGGGTGGKGGKGPVLVLGMRRVVMMNRSTC